MNRFFIAEKIAEQSAGGTIDTQIAFLALVVAAISLLVSIYAILQNRKINTTNLEAKYFEEVFREYSVNKIPDCVSKLEFENGKLNEEYRNLNHIMMEMIRKAKYYAYAKREFYLELQRKTMALEDKLMDKARDNVADIEEQAEFIYSVHMDIMDIIKYINKNYHDF